MDTTANRVPAHTAEEVNQRIWRQTDSNIRYYADHLDEIDGRLTELEREWDIERTLEANAASISVLAELLGLLTEGERHALKALEQGVLTSAPRPCNAADANGSLEQWFWRSLRQQPGRMRPSSVSVPLSPGRRTSIGRQSPCGVW